MIIRHIYGKRFTSFQSKDQFTPFRHGAMAVFGLCALHRVPSCQRLDAQQTAATRQCRTLQQSVHLCNGMGGVPGKPYENGMGLWNRLMESDSPDIHGRSMKELNVSHLHFFQGFCIEKLRFSDENHGFRSGLYARSPRRCLAASHQQSRQSQQSQIISKQSKEQKLESLKYMAFWNLDCKWVLKVVRETVHSLVGLHKKV